MEKQYSYKDAGFDSFMSRSIDNQMFTANGLTLDTLRPMYLPAQQVAYDRTQVSGQLGDTMSLGSIALDGTTGRISIVDDSGNTIVVIGDLGD